jgi:hypothetical protein
LKARGEETAVSEPTPTKQTHEIFVKHDEKENALKKAAATLEIVKSAPQRDHHKAIRQQQ